MCRYLGKGGEIHDLKQKTAHGQNKPQRTNYKLKQTAMNKKVYIVCECDTWGRNPDFKGIFDSLDAAVSNIMDNCGYSEDELNCVTDMREYLADYRCTPNLKWNYSIQEYELNEWV